MFTKNLASLKNLDKKTKDKEILRLGIIAELDAISFYEQLAAATDDPKLKTVLMDIAKEEKTHVGEFQALLLKLDKEQEVELKEGQKEIEELT
jgi:rubrerythrin